MADSTPPHRPRLPVRTALVGAGYIAEWHAEALAATPGTRLVGVVDPAAAARDAFAAAWGVPAYPSVEELVAAGIADAVHILTPPNLHRELALECIAAGLDVLVEKPVALSADETREIVTAADAAGRRFAAGHNFLGLPGYRRLKRQVRSGALGRVSSVSIVWALPLAPLRSGPYGLWLMRETRNLLLEIGPHPVSFAVDLFGPLEIRALETGQPVALPGGGERPQSWRILARAGAVDVTIAVSLVETFDERTVTVRGSTGLARLDYAADVLTGSADNTADLILNPFLKEVGQAARHLREGIGNAVVQVASLNRASPYGRSFRGMVGAFHDAIRSGRPMDPRFSGRTAVSVMQAIDDTLALLPPQPAPMIAAGTARPDMVVIGGTGYIGRGLVRALVAKGHDVRVLSRGGSGPFDDIADHVETVPVSLRDSEGLTEAMRGMRAVYNLAKSVDTTWEAALKNDVGTAVRVGEAALAAGVGRLIYTGTIASYDMSDPTTVITEETGFGDTGDRNLYARSKAECEARLMAMHHDRGLPLVIARPGIVVGAGGPLQHWGIGRWHGAGTVKLWGSGRNVLPFVLCDDVADALVAMSDSDAAIGRSFNLIGEPMLTGRAYFAAIRDRLGANLRVSAGSLPAMWLADGVKHALKTRVLRTRGAVRPSLADWRSRGHFARFDTTLPKEVLGWQPETDREAFLRRAVDEAGLFGL